MRSFKDISIKNKLHLIIMLACGTVLTFSVTALLGAELLLFRNSINDDLSILADVIGANSSAALLFQDHEAAKKSLAALKAEPHIVAARILTPAGETFAEYFSDKTKKTLSKDNFFDGADLWRFFRKSAERKKELLFAAQNIHFDGEVVGGIEIFSGLQKFYTRVKWYALIGLAVFFASSLMAFFLSSALQRVISNPVVRLAETIKRVSKEKNYSLRAEQHSRDELGLLIAGFNDMLEKIQDRDAKLHSHRDYLEEVVAQRTVELEKTNMRLKKAVYQLKNAKDAAEAASEAKSQFLANMSHELRTPLNHIIGFTEIVVDQHFGELNQSQTDYLNDVLNSSQHLLSLINDILDLSKIESGKLELSLAEIELRPLVDNSLLMIKEKASKHGIKLTTRFKNTPEKICADERKLKQIIYNLLSNAVKFTPDGGEILIYARGVSLKRRKNAPPSGNGKRIQICVKDTGVGIDRDDQKRIFDAFEQADNSSSRHYQGTGLGLSLTKKLVELHGGRIWVESEGLGRGSRFHFDIPAHTLPVGEGREKASLKAF